VSPLQYPIRTLVILPAHNEEEALPAVLAELRLAMPAAVLAVVDDGSSDNTVAVALRGGAVVIPLPFNVGVGGAVRVGLLYAMRSGFDIVVQCDADGQHPASSIPDLIAGLTEADVVIGARFAGEGDYTARGPRRAAMRMLAIILTRVHHTLLTDVTSGFRAFGHDAIRVLAAELPPDYLADTVEALVIARRARLRVVQVPVAMRTRQGGTATQSGLTSSVFLMRSLLVIGLALLQLARPTRRMGRDTV
jgi:glycosyltransferase involved in cell wall biosynthesis